jgi:hypothetical protein
MSLGKPRSQIFPGFLHPGLSGSYVFTAVCSAVIFIIYYLGHGSWLRIFGFCVIPFLLITVLVVSLAGWLQIQIWKKLIRPANSDLSHMPLLEFLRRSVVTAIVIIPLSAVTGDKLCEVHARRICADCTSLVSELGKEKKLRGVYPTNAVAIVKAHPKLKRKHSFYFGQAGTNGVDWTPTELAQAHISLFVNPNHFQLVVPIERMSPITFSSFYVYSLTSERPEWRKTLLHWSLLGSYFDEPMQ